MAKILIVEDDVHISEMLETLLGGHGYETTSAFSGTEGLMVLKYEVFDLMLLDLMLPGKTGEEVLSEMRKTSNMPVVVMTAKTDMESTAKLLRMGADDYIKKPFDNDELLARIEVQLRKSASAQSALNTGGLADAAGAKTLTHKNMRLDVESFDAFVGDVRAGLSKREYEILHLMMASPNKVFTKNNLYESVWGGEFLGDDNTINVHISKLRSKLGDISGGEEFIQTVWGIGFKMKD